MAVPLSVSQRLQRKLPRSVKFTRRWLRVICERRVPDTRLVFVVGSQRSGTRLPLHAMDRSPQIMTYSEGSAPFFDRVLLRPLPVVERLVARSPFPVLALKPICETHRVGELLERFPRSRSVWIFRNFRDAVSSASVKWSSGKEAVRRLAAGELDRAGWRAGGLTPAKLSMVRDLYSDSLSLHAANAVMWYLRNDLFFDLGLSSREDVLLVRYEDLVASPRKALGRVFEFVGVPLPEDFDKGIYTSSVAKRPFPPIPGTVETLCCELEQRLTEHYERAVGMVNRRNR